MKTPLLTYRSAKKSDLPFLLKLRKDSMEEHLIAAGIPISDDEHMKRILFQFESAQIISLDLEEIGLLKTLEKTDHVEIIQFQILPKYQGQGIGKQVLNNVWNRAKSRKMSVCLSVLKSNRAIRLYKKLGFEIIGETKDSFNMIIT